MVTHRLHPTVNCVPGLQVTLRLAGAGSVVPVHAGRHAKNAVGHYHLGTAVMVAAAAETRTPNSRMHTHTTRRDASGIRGSGQEQDRRFFVHLATTNEKSEF